MNEQPLLRRRGNLHGTRQRQSLKDIKIAQNPPQEYENKNGRKTTAAQFPCSSSSHSASQ